MGHAGAFRRVVVFVLASLFVFGARCSNQPPELQTVGDKTVDEGDALVFEVLAVDPDGDTLTYTARELPQGAAFNAATRTFSWTPGYDQAGTYTNVTFTVTDGQESDSEAITISVVDVCPDRDDDGYTDAACGGTDCDDGSDTTYPGAAESCDDGVDNDCDGLNDEDDPDCEGPGDEVVTVPAGTFWMGCDESEYGCWPEEYPRHEVYVSEFEIDTYEVTNQQYADFLNEVNPSNSCDGAQCAETMHPSELGMYESEGTWLVDSTYEDRPVLQVTWYGAKAFCEAQGKRLPTEAEWEKAAKGATESYVFPWGDVWNDDAANWADQDDPFESGTYPWTTPVGYFDGSDHDGTYQTVDGRSPYGAHDMAGNAWEWVNDWWLETYYETYAPGEWPADPQGPETGEARVVRGAGWFNLGTVGVSMRTAARNACEPADWTDGIGFRCVRD